mgnify:CR=1 FL=1
MKPENGAACHDLLVKEETPRLAFPPCGFCKMAGARKGGFLKKAPF